MSKKRVYALYRVSTKKQVDKVKDKETEQIIDDIPLQKKAIRDFIASKQDWEFYKEISELGVSGFKVSAKNRDAILEIQKEALEKKFDVLVVFLFDRLGRKEDETPFIVEWFVNHGIEVWSVKEGEQRFDNHVDKLTNYIRFWQASGESIKTSIRLKTCFAQMIQEGSYRGGSVAFGYRTEKRGRLNKKNHEIHDIVIDEKEATIVKEIFDLYVLKGMGSHRIAHYLNERGITTHKGGRFVNCTVNSMIANRTYTGVLKCGDVVSDIFPHLQIIDPDTFEAAQHIKQSRSINKDDRTIPLNTNGSSLLSGNVFCGHCGGRLIVTTNGKKYIRKDGDVTVTPRTRYVCYKKSRHKQCDGQTGYTVSKLDNMIVEVVHRLFNQFKDIPKESILKQRFAEQVSKYKTELKDAKAIHKANLLEMKEYETEVLKIIRGESNFNSELLNKLYEEAQEKVAQSEHAVSLIEDQIDDNEKTKSTISKHLDNIQSWADIFDDCDMETKKMILSNIMKRIKVSRDYEIEIDLTITCEDLGISFEEINEPISSDKNVA